MRSLGYPVPREGGLAQMEVSESMVKQVISSRSAEPGLQPKATVRKHDFELVVFVLADGVKPDVLKALIDSGRMPNISRHLLSKGSYRDGVTVLPSVTDVAYLPMLTGQYPGTANIPGIRWVDKSQFKPGLLRLKGHRSYIGTSHVRFNGDLPNELETLFEMCPDSLAVRSDVHRGLPPGANRFHGISMPMMFFSHYFKRADFVDKIVLGSLLRSLGRRESDLPRFVFLPLLDVDTASHARGPEHRRTLDAYRRIDAVVGTIVDRLKRFGIWDRTLLLMSSDHGHTETSEHLDLTRLISEQGYNVFEHPNIYKRNVDAAVMVSGNAFANVYVSSEGKWERPLVGEELEVEHRKLLDALRKRVEIEWISYRGQDGSVKVVSNSGAALLRKTGDSFSYMYEDSDPLQLGLSRTTIHESEALSITVDSRFPDALEQLWHLFAGQRTGDIVVTSKPGYDLRGWREWPKHNSSHGALSREQMMVPILSSEEIASEGPIRTIDLFSTISESLGLTHSKPYFGRSIW